MCVGESKITITGVFNMNNVIGYIIKKNIFSFIILGILLLIMSGMSIGTSTILMKIIDDILPELNFHRLVVAISVYISLCILQIIFSYIGTYYNVVFTMQTEMELKKIITDKLLWKSGSFFLNHNSGDIYQIVVGDITQVCSFVIDNTFSIMYIAFSLLSSSIYLIILNWKLFILILFLQPLSVIVQVIMSPLITRRSREQREIVGNYIMATQDVFFNPIELIVSGLRDWFVTRMNQRMMKQYSISKKMQVANGIINQLTELVGILTTCAVIAYGGYSIIYGEMSMGVLIVFITYSQKLTVAFDSMWEFSIDFSEISPIYERVNKYFSEDCSARDGKIFNTVTPNLEFQNVTFSYDKKRKIYNNVNQVFEYGKKYGIVGKSGEGKSTFVKLIYGLWELDKGRIILGESECADVDRESINEILMYISADMFIINDTIYNNLVLGKEDIEKDEVYAALKKVGLYEEINEMKDGIGTVIGDNGNALSTGQKQRLALARAIIAKRKITILDEPTSALDVVTQERVMQALYEEFKDSTLIIITHSKAILQNCDDIFELKNGVFLSQGKI